ncbi:cysteine protease [Lithohypha guttulata]|nr:cysteine protease [Lithohypha guttulata]
MSAASTKALQDVEAKAIAAEKRVSAHDGSGTQLEAAISAAELYMRALKLAASPDDRRRLDRKTKQLISRAEELKVRHDCKPTVNAEKRARIEVPYPVSQRVLTTREKIILLESSKLNGAIFKQWTAPPLQEEFELKGNDFFTDDFDFTLSEAQLKHFAGWKRPKDAFAHVRVEKNGQLLPNEATMISLGSLDMVQDVAPDCSVIASFCVGASRIERGHKRLYGQIVYPYDHNSDQPCESANGRYVLRLYFNGCWRRVDIDDRLPTSKSSRVLHVVDRSQPGLVWPAIVEKAYLKVRGGYNFPGSNSGTDLAVITGWMPQQVFLHDDDVEPRSLWDELHPAFNDGQVMCTLGTGKLGRREQQLLGLGAEHDYAVLDMKENDDVREILIKNPWADGDVWKGATRYRPHPGHEEGAPQSPQSGGEVEKMEPGTFWMDFNLVFQYFEHMYLNWNPNLFSHREDRHFTWHLSEVMQAGHLLIDNPQFSVRTRRAGQLWILLNRHFRTGDYSVENHGSNGYISLYLFNKHGETVFSSDNARVRGPFVDSPNTLLRFHAEAKMNYSIVAVSQDLPRGKHNFTISAFSNCPVELDEASDTYGQPVSIMAAWTRSTAGGNAGSSTYLQNPQFTLQVGRESRAVIVLKSLSDTASTELNLGLHVKILILSSDGRRITKLRKRDTVSQSGDYKRGSTVVETILQRGSYTIICSTFEPGQLSKFQLDFYTTLGPAEYMIKPLLPEGSGRLSIKPAPAIFENGTTKVIAPLKVTRVTRALFKAWQMKGSSSSLFKMSIEQGQGPYRNCVVTSSTDEAEYANIQSGLRIEDIDLDASLASSQNGGLWLVLEKPQQASTESKDANVLQVEVLTEESIEVGAWAPLDD